MVVTPWLGITKVIAGLPNLTYFPAMVFWPFLVKDTLHANVDLLGYYYSAVALGALQGSSRMGRYSSLRRRGPKLYAASMLCGTELLVIGLALTPSVFLLTDLIIGGSKAVSGLIWVNVIKEQVPRDLQGRVSSIDYLGSSLLGPAGYLVGGWLMLLPGPALVFMLGGALQKGLIGVGLLHPRVRQLD